MKDPAVNQAELVGTTANVRCQFVDFISGPAVVVATSTESAGAVFTVGTTVFGKHLTTEVTGLKGYCWFIYGRLVYCCPCTAVGTLWYYTPPLQGVTLFSVIAEC